MNDKKREQLKERIPEEIRLQARSLAMDVILFATGIVISVIGLGFFFLTCDSLLIGSILAFISVFFFHALYYTVQKIKGLNLLKYNASEPDQGLGDPHENLDS